MSGTDAYYEVEFEQLDVGDRFKFNGKWWVKTGHPRWIDRHDAERSIDKYVNCASRHSRGLCLGPHHVVKVRFVISGE